MDTIYNEDWERATSISHLQSKEERRSGQVSNHEWLKTWVRPQWRYVIWAYHITMGSNLVSV